RSALVRCESTREADGQSVRPVRVQMLRDVTPLSRAQALACVLTLQALAHAGEHARLHGLRRRPELIVGEMFDGGPELVVAQPLAPVVADGVIEMALPRLMDKRGRMNAVRDKADRVVFGPDLGPVIGAQAR